jgi:hypothetical protein
MACEATYDQVVGINNVPFAIDLILFYGNGFITLFHNPYFNSGAKVVLMNQ